MHTVPRFSMLLAGSIAEIDERKRSDVTGPLTLHFSPAGRTHGHRIESRRVKCLCFDLAPDMKGELGASAAVLDAPITLRTGQVVSMITRMHQEICRSDDASDLVLRGLIFELIGLLDRRSERRRRSDAPAWLLRAREMIRETSGESVNLADVAAAVGVHPSSLTRVFRQFLSSSPGEYLRQVRIEQATREVLLTDRPLKEIARAAGFSDPAHFSREFRRANGASPREVRQRRG